MHCIIYVITVYRTPCVTIHCIENYTIGVWKLPIPPQHHTQSDMQSDMRFGDLGYKRSTRDLVFNTYTRMLFNFCADTLRSTSAIEVRPTERGPNVGVHLTGIQPYTLATLMT